MKKETEREHVICCHVEPTHQPFVIVMVRFLSRNSMKVGVYDDPNLSQVFPSFWNEAVINHAILSNIPATWGKSDRRATRTSKPKKEEERWKKERKKARKITKDSSIEQNGKEKYKNIRIFTAKEQKKRNNILKRNKKKINKKFHGVMR